MCGRFALAPKKNFVFHYGLNNPNDEKVFFSHNICPSTKIPVVVRNEANEIEWMLWGWWKGKVINARVETVEKKPWFQSSIKKFRCIIPVSGFYEWKNEKGKKIPYRFRSLRQEIISLAGIYRKSKETGNFECLILTTDANSSVKNIHHRMPVMLPDAWENYWLSSHLDIPFSQLMVANEAYKLKMEKMNPFINSPRYNLDPEVVHGA